MVDRTLLLSALFMVVLTGCATTTESLGTRAQAREEGLQAVSISGGACDGVGQFMPVQNDRVSLEVSAEPAR